jgi:hypothetical protein
MNMKFTFDKQKTIIYDSIDGVLVNFNSISLLGLKLIISSAKL